MPDAVFVDSHYAHWREQLERVQSVYDRLARTELDSELKIRILRLLAAREDGLLEKLHRSEQWKEF